MKYNAKTLVIMGLMLGLATPSFAKTKEYSLVIDKQKMNITGKPAERITINGTIPGPTLEFTEGDEAVVHVTNKMNEDTSVHWHGVLVPGAMDGVPNFNGFPGIKAGETFTYRFKIRQNGTYWYHSHSGAQEQDGHYGPMIIRPKGGETVKTDRDYVVLLSEFHEDDGNTILSNLKKTPEYYTHKDKGNSREKHGKMGMKSTDLADVGNYTFLVNGKTADQNWTGLFKPGEKIRLRFINASAMSYYDVRIPGLEMTVIAADGQPVEPVKVDEFRFGVAETYDVIVTPKENKAYTIAAESIDRTGFALATLAPREGMRGEKAKPRPVSPLTMADMGMKNRMKKMKGMEQDNSSHMSGKNHSVQMKQGKERHAVAHQSNHTDAPVNDFDTAVPGSGCANANTPKGKKALSYKDLRYAGTQKDQRAPEREITVRLGGSMKNYVWTLNGKKYEDSKPIKLNYGERVRLTFVNDTMMAHPMHLHGMFVQLENGQPMAKLPNKHTVTVAPGDTYSVLLTADEAGEWAFHCHLIYHMGAGMMNKVVVAKLDSVAVRETPIHL